MRKEYNFIYMKTTPEQIVKQWSIGDVREVRRATTGIFNETYIVHTAHDTYVLQKLHPLIAGKSATQNYATLTAHFASVGVPTQVVVPTKGGRIELLYKNEGWRMLKAIHGNVFARAENPSLAREAGKKLGETHAMLGTLRVELLPALPMFRYDAVHATLKKVTSYFKRTGDEEALALGTFLLHEWPPLFLPARLPLRVIHTDPKVSNFIFDSEGKAVAMIDWDTAQKLSPLYDVGDALRSFCGGREDDAKIEFAMPRGKALVEGYLAGVGKYMTLRERKLIPRAGGLVMLGLAARFLNDYHEDFYFGWDKERYPNRRAHNLARAKGQVALYKDFKRKKGELEALVQ